MDGFEAHDGVVVSLVSASMGQAGAQRDAFVAELGAARFVGGAMLCPPPAMRVGQCLNLIGGSAAAVARARPALELLGAAQAVGENPAEAAAADLVIVTAVQHLMNGALAALGMVKRAGFDPAVGAGFVNNLMPMLLPVVKATMDTGMKASLAEFQAEGAKDASVWSHYAFNRHTLESCRELDAPCCALFEGVDELYRPLVEAGHEKLHLSAVMEHVAGGKALRGDKEEL